MFTVCTAGELLVEVMRPAADQPLDRTGPFMGPFPSGAPVIFIDAMSRWGAKAHLFSAVGDDAFGSLCLSRLAEDGVDVSDVARISGYTTAIAFVSYRSGGERDFLFHAAHSAVSQMALPDGWEARCRGIDLLHVAGSSLLLHPAVREVCLRLVEAVHAGGGTISFDPNIRPELIADDGEARAAFAPVLNRASYLFPSGSELQWMTGLADVAEAAGRMTAAGISAVVLKDGKRGATLYTAERRLHCAGFRVEETDPTGAGDVFCAGFLFGQLSGWDNETSLRFANAAGALNVTRLGPMEGIAPLHEVYRFMEIQGRGI